MNDLANKLLGRKRRIHILIADDDALFLHIVQKLLKEEGFEVITASTGEEALKMVQERKPSLVILDSNMPSMTGEEVCKCIKLLTFKNPIPVIILSGLEDENSIKRFAEYGCDDYFPKSQLIFNISGTLKERVRKALKSL
jgi:DNA-binding response OmpR family regulator